MTMKASRAEFTNRHVMSLHLVHVQYKDVVISDKIFTQNCFEHENPHCIVFWDASAL